MSASLASFQPALASIDGTGICIENNITYISVGFPWPEGEETDEIIRGRFDVLHTIESAVLAAGCTYMEDDAFKSNTLVATKIDEAPEGTTYEVFDLSVSPTDPFAIVVTMPQEKRLKAEKWGIYTNYPLDHQAVVYHPSAVPAACS